jgi:O-antigen ligase
MSFSSQIALLVLVLILRREKARALIAGAAVLAIAMAMVSWLGVRQILERFSSLQTLEATRNKRMAMAVGTWHVFLDHPLAGTGLGTIEAVYPPYETLYDGKVVNHSHNDYLEALAETGILGGLICALFLGTLLLESWRRLATDSTFVASLHLAAVVGCFGFLVHSLVDFNLHIPANALLFFLMAHLATSEIPSGTAQVPNRHPNRT